MPTLIHPAPSRPTEPAAPASFRVPHYDCEDLPQALKLTVYVPGVATHGVELSSRGSDLVVVARKARHVRVNWSALQLEAAQLDYRLRLRLGGSFNFAALEASLHDGVLSLTLPKRARPAARTVTPPFGRTERRRVA